MSTQPDDAPRPGSLVWDWPGPPQWRWEGAGDPWLGADRGGPERSRDSEHRGDGTGKAPGTPLEKIKNDSPVTITPSPPDILSYSMAVEPLWRAQSTRRQDSATWVAAMVQRAQERAADVAPITERHRSRLAEQG